MTPDLDAIEARLEDGTWTRRDFKALVSELRATTGDLAVAVEVARERGEALADLRAGIEALRDVWRARIASLRAVDSYAATLCDEHADALDALLGGA